MTLTTDARILPDGLTLEALRREAARAYELDRAHVFHSWSAQAQITPMTITAAQGGYVWDGDGNRLLDFSSQLVNTNIGHQHPRVVAAVQEQAAKLCTVAPQHANAARSEAARLIAEHTPGDLNKIFFTNGGADANEHAVRMARLHTGRYKVLTRYRSYHGGTDTAINLTGDPRRWRPTTTATAVSCASTGHSSTARHFTRRTNSRRRRGLLSTSSAHRW